MSSSHSADNIVISDITIKSSTVIAEINLSMGSTFNVSSVTDKVKEVTPQLGPDELVLSSSTPLIIKVRLESRFFNKRHKEIKIKRQDLSSGTVDVETNKYRRSVDGIEVIIGFKFILRPTTDVIFDICPRFRVLVIGRTGAGKTSLIANTFGVTDVLISHSEVGECDINKELFSPNENGKFVLHDSQGFEPGDTENFDTVMKFLIDRKQKPDIKDQVHAVWLCFSIPVDGDRLLERGAEKFLQLLAKGELDGLPIIAVFTKYDKLVTRIRRRDFAENFDEEGLQKKVDDTFNELCIKPFEEQIVGMTQKIPEIAVSTNKSYKRTLHDLTQLTAKLVGKHLTTDVAVVSAVAQQVSPTVKLDAVIDVGKKRYWQGLASTIKLPGNQSQIVLENIHQDIVQIFNLQDPKKLLDSDEFKKLITVMVTTEQDVLSLKQMSTSFSMLGALAGIVSALSGPAVPIVVPIAAVLVVGHWTVLLLKQADIVVQRLMNYIVALTLIMQMIFVTTTSANGVHVVSRRLIKLAVTFFHNSQKGIIYTSIKQYLQTLGSQFDREAILQKITELIQSNRISPEDMAAIETTMKDFDGQADEPWA